MQVQSAFYAPTELTQLSLVNGKSSKSHAFDPSAHLPSQINSTCQVTHWIRSMLMAADTRESFKILMPAAISNTMKPRNESIGKKNTAAGKSSSTAMKIQKSYSIIFARFYSCAVYSQKYADCEGFNLFPSLDTYIKPQLTGFAVGNNGMVYFTARYLRSIYSMDLKIVRNLNFLLWKFWLIFALRANRRWKFLSRTLFSPQSTPLRWTSPKQRCSWQLLTRHHLQFSAFHLTVLSPHCIRMLPRRTTS